MAVRVARARRGARRAGRRPAAGAGAAAPLAAAGGRASRSRGWRNALARGGVRGQRRAAAAARVPGRRAGRAGAAAAHPRRRPGQHPRRPARQRADERAVRGACWSSSRRASRRSSTTPAAIGTCSGCSRTCSARTRWASATCCWSPAIRRRSATIPDATAVFDVDSIGLTNVVVAAESRARHRRPADRQPDRVPHRRRGRIPARSNLDEELRRFRYKVEAGAEFAITQPVFDADELARFLERIDDARHPGARRHHAAREPAARRVHGQRGAGRARARTRWSSGCAARRPTGRAAAEGMAIAREVVAAIRAGPGLQITTASADRSTRAAWAIDDGFAPAGPV